MNPQLDVQDEPFAHCGKAFLARNISTFATIGVEMSAGYLVRRKILNCNDFNIRLSHSFENEVVVRHFKWDSAS